MSITFCKKNTFDIKRPDWKGPLDIRFDITSDSNKKNQCLNILTMYLLIELWEYWDHYRWFLSGNGQNMNFGFGFFLVQNIADHMYFHMVCHTFIWNHCDCHRKVLNMTHFQLFASFIQTLLVRKKWKKSTLLIWHTFAPKNNLQWLNWDLPMSPYQILRGTLRWG